MEELRNYLNSISTEEQRLFAIRCGTTIGYLRKAICINQKLGLVLCAAIERESSGSVTKQVLRHDVDFREFAVVERIAA